jgi:hypothetical protein
MARSSLLALLLPQAILAIGISPGNNEGLAWQDQLKFNCDPVVTPEESDRRLQGFSFQSFKFTKKMEDIPVLRFFQLFLLRLEFSFDKKTPRLL